MQELESESLDDKLKRRLEEIMQKVASVSSVKFEQGDVYTGIRGSFLGEGTVAFAGKKLYVNCVEFMSVAYTAEGVFSSSNNTDNAPVMNAMVDALSDAFREWEEENEA